MSRGHSKIDRLNNELRNQQMLDNLGSVSSAGADRIRRRRIPNRVYHNCTACGCPIDASYTGLCSLCKAKIMG